MLTMKNHYIIHNIEEYPTKQNEMRSFIATYENVQWKLIWLIDM